MISTRGCVSCTYQKESLQSAYESIIEDHPDNAYPKFEELFKQYDCLDVPGWIASNVVLRDFPVTIILENSVIKTCINGNKTVNYNKTVLDTFVNP